MHRFTLRRRVVAMAAFGLIALAASAPSAAAQKITTPKEFFGHNIGDDYWLPNYTQFVGYWQKVAKEERDLRTVCLAFELHGGNCAFPLFVAMNDVEHSTSSQS